MAFKPHAPFFSSCLTCGQVSRKALACSLNLVKISYSSLYSSQSQPAWVSTLPSTESHTMQIMNLAHLFASIASTISTSEPVLGRGIVSVVLQPPQNDWYCEQDGLGGDCHPLRVVSCFQLADWPCGLLSSMCTQQLPAR